MEHWRPVAEYPGYSVSTLGRLRADYCLTGKIKGGQGSNKIRDLRARGGIIAGSHERNGYLQARVRFNGGRRQIIIHRLVAATFLGPIPDGQEVNHRNGVKADNSVKNLEYVTHGENMQHCASVLGKMNRTGTKNGMCTISESTARKIIAALERAPRRGNAAVARKFGVPYHIITNIVRGRTWNHLR